MAERAGGGYGRNGNWERSGYGSGRPKRKSKKKKQSIWTSRDKAERLWSWMQRQGGPERFSVDELEEIFSQGMKKHKDVEREWKYCLTQWRYDNAPILGESHPHPDPQTRAHSGLEPGGYPPALNRRALSLVAEPYERGPHERGDQHQQEGYYPQGDAPYPGPVEKTAMSYGGGYPGSPGPPSRQPGVLTLQHGASSAGATRSSYGGMTEQEVSAPSVLWHDFDQPETDNMGCFFLNKFYLHEDKSKFWKPPHLHGTRTRLLGFEDLVPLDGLQSALVVNEAWLGTMLEYVCRFPPSVSSTVVCAKKTPDQNPNLPEQVWVCPTHSRDDHARYRENGELVDCQCECSDKRQILLIHPDQDIRMRCHFLLLRYENHLRVIISSASFNPLSWERFSHFGWFCDLPLLSQPAVDPLADDHPFKLDMCCFLRDLGASIVVSQFLDGVDYSALSPLVNLVCTVPKQDISGKLGYGKLHALKEQMMWPSLYNQKVCLLQTSKLRAKTNIILQLIFDISLETVMKPTQKELTIVYPSNRRGQEVKSHNPYMTKEVVADLFEDFDRYMDSCVHLHDLDTDVPVFSMSNIFRQHQVTKPSSSESETLALAGQPHFGWLMTGSHITGVGSWGTSKPRFHYKDGGGLNRYDLSVCIFPFHDCEANVLHALDLRLIGLPFLHPRPHHITDFPYSTATGELQYHCIGEMARHVNQRTSGFVERLPPDHPMQRSFDAYPSIQHGDHRQGYSAYLHRDTCQKFNLRDLPDIGSIIEFVGVMVELKGFRIRKIIRVFQSEKEAVNAFGSAFMLGIQKEEDQDKYWNKKFNAVVSKEKKKHQPGSQAEINAKFPMNPTRLVDTMAWLEKHVRQTCHDRIPPLTGPYNMEVLKNTKAAYKNHLLGKLKGKEVKGQDDEVPGHEEVIGQGGVEDEGSVVNGSEFKENCEPVGQEDRREA